MTIVVPNIGESDMLSAALNKAAASNQTLKLYKSNTTPAETDTASTYTEATFGGYASKSLTGSSWSITEGAPTEATYSSAQTFTCNTTTNESVYGYFLVRTTGGNLMWAERFTDGPYVMTVSGDTITLTPRISME